MVVMNKLLNMLQGKDPECLQQLEKSTAVMAPAAKKTPTAAENQQSSAVVAMRMGGSKKIAVKETITIKGIVLPVGKGDKVMSCTLCKAFGDNATFHTRASCLNCPNFGVRKETISMPMKLTQEHCTETSIRYPIEYWPNTNYSDTDFPIPSGAVAGEEWVAVMPKAQLHKAKQIPRNLAPWAKTKVKKGKAAEKVVVDRETVLSELMSQEFMRPDAQSLTLDEIVTQFNTTQGSQESLGFTAAEVRAMAIQFEDDNKVMLDGDTVYPIIDNQDWS